VTLRQQLTPQDRVYFNAQQYDATGGDDSQYYNQSMANPSFRYKEFQNPIISLGYDHEWNPGIHTLFFAARLNDTTSFTNPAQPALLVVTPDFLPGLGITAVHNLTMHENYQDRLNI